MDSSTGKWLNLADVSNDEIVPGQWLMRRSLSGLRRVETVGKGGLTHTDLRNVYDEIYTHPVVVPLEPTPAPIRPAGLAQGIEEPEEATWKQVLRAAVPLDQKRLEEIVLADAVPSQEEMRAIADGLIQLAQQVAKLRELRDCGEATAVDNDSRSSEERKQELEEQLIHAQDELDELLRGWVVAADAQWELKGYGDDWRIEVEGLKAATIERERWRVSGEVRKWRWSIWDTTGCGDQNTGYVYETKEAAFADALRAAQDLWKSRGNYLAQEAAGGTSDADYSEAGM